MSNTLKKVTVITACYNNAETIQDTLSSLLNQSYKNIEYIIVDGKSTDETLSLIDEQRKHLKDEFNSFLLISEKDNGIADAWNKGLKIASGEIIFFLNSDDWIEPTAIEKAVNGLNTDNLELSYGVCTRINSKKEKTESFQKKFFKFRELWNFGFSFTTCFITKKVYDEIGGFNTNYKIAIDSEFLLRCLKQRVKFKQGNHETFMRIGGVSTKFRLAAHNEYKKALINNGYPKLLVNLSHFFFKNT